MSKASLVLAGSGIKFVSHLTTETRTYIEQSDQVLYLVNDSVMKKWIQQNSKQSESLEKLYTQYSLRKDCYQSISDYILAKVRENRHICVVLYGHPCVFSQPGLNAVRQAKKEGYYAKILPAISAEDCLFADLLIDPGSHGCQSYEATDFLVYKRKFDISGHLILWQIDAIGILDHCYSRERSEAGIIILYNYLSQFYHQNYEIIIYEAAQYPSFEPRIDKIKLNYLPHVQLSGISSLYIPPSQKISYDAATLEALKINIADL